MKKLSIIFMFVMITIAVSAQTSGGEVIRKPNAEKRQSHDNLSVTRRKDPSIITNKIQRNINGVTIGKSSKQDVISHLKYYGHSYQIKDKGTTVRSNKNVRFGGIIWDEVCYVFVSDILFKIVYTKSGSEKINDIIADGKYLRDNLFNKYRSFYIPNTSTEFSDGNTGINLTEMYSRSSPFIGLQYYEVIALDKDVDDL